MEEQKKQPLLDHEDWLYLAATACISGGIGFHLAGIVALGVMLLFWPIMARICSSRKDSQK